jgi:hypothetical protein
MVTSPLGLQRTVPTTPTFNGVTPGSQFWTKIYEHEYAHIGHFTSGPWETYQTVNGLWSHIAGLWAPTQAQLYGLIQFFREYYLASQDIEKLPRSKASEQLAYAYSDGYAPHYFFEAACHPEIY